MTKTLQFPDGFLWGVSTSGYQFEGGNRHSQWAAWEEAGGIKTGESSGRACGWWENAEQDFDLARDIGVNALRISVEWSRVEPRPGEWDTQALRRYREMLLGLRRRGILPVVSLHHFTHPQWFEEQGAFLAEGSDSLFEQFVARVLTALGDVCHHWVTFNEPNVYVAMSYLLGEFPPGKKGEVQAAGKVLGNIARAHARAFRAIHALSPRSQAGLTTNYIAFQPSDPESGLDRMAASFQHQLFNMSFDALLKNGSYPFPLSVWAGDCSSAKGQCDFVGINVYSRAHVKFDLKLPGQLFGELFIPGHVPQGDRGVHNPYGEAFPQGISMAVRDLHFPDKPIYILENGVPDREDRIRPWLLTNAVREMHQIIEQGFDVRGYFHWSLVDNFEWAEGWTLRFGLAALDPETQERRLRFSGEIYRSIANANGLPHEIAEAHPPEDHHALNVET
ncbi:MAG: family 1 glycosylhydrolase [Acidobacteriia bacterium]|nr:family 1 glycosylhydrolase [Terriglobia bacterium]